MEEVTSRIKNEVMLRVEVKTKSRLTPWEEVMSRVEDEVSSHTIGRGRLR